MNKRNKISRKRKNLSRKRGGRANQKLFRNKNTSNGGGKKKKERGSFSPHIERRYCMHYGNFKSEEDYYRQKDDYKRLKTEPNNEYKKCMDMFYKSPYGKLKKSLRKLKRKKNRKSRELFGGTKSSKKSKGPIKKKIHKKKKSKKVKYITTQGKNPWILYSGQNQELFYPRHVEQIKLNDAKKISLDAENSFYQKYKPFLGPGRIPPSIENEYMLYGS